MPVPAARAPRHPAGRLAADPGAGRGEAAGAPHHPYALEVRGGRARALRRRSTASSSRSTTRSRTRSRSPIRTPAGLVLHTGDFKMDQLPLDGRLTDLRAFARLGDEGVDLFLVDSTNAEVPGLHHPRARHRPGARPGLRAGAASGSSSPASPATCTGCSRCSTPRVRHRPQGRVRRPVDGAQHGRRPRPRLPATSPAGLLVDAQGARRRCPTTRSC